MSIAALLANVASYARRYSDQDPKPLLIFVREQAAEMRRERLVGPRVLRTREEARYLRDNRTDRFRNGRPFRQVAAG